MKITKQSRREGKELFRACLKNGLLDENCARQTVKLVLEKKPRGFPGILQHFQRLIKLEQDRRTARIQSAVALPEETKADLRQKLAKIYGPGLLVSLSENRELIGGLRVQVGSDVYDGTVQNRLRALEQGF